MKRILSFLILFVIFLYAMPVYPAGNDIEKLVLTPKTEKYYAGNFAYYYIDPTRNLTLEDIRKADKDPGKELFKRLNKKSFGSGYGDKVLWIKLLVENPQTNPGDYVLEIPIPTLDKIDFHIIKPGTVKTINTGDHHPFRTRETNNRKFIFAIEKSASPLTYYIRIRSSSRKTFEPVIWEREAFLSSDAVKLAMIWIYTGIMLVMALYHLLLFATLKDRTYLYYVAICVVYLLHQLSFTGLSYQYFWPEATWLAHWSTPIIAALGCFTMTQFARHFLEIKRYAKNFDRLLLALSLLPLFSIQIFIFFNSSGPLILSYLLFLIFGVTGLVVFSIQRILKGDRGALFYFVSWIFFFTGAAIVLLSSMNIISLGNNASHAMLPGNTLQVILLSFGLTDRINTLKRKLLELNINLVDTNEELANFKKFAEASGQGLGMADIEGNITYANPSLYRILRADKPHQLEKKYFSSYYPPDSKEKVKNEIIPEVLKNGKWTGEIKLQSVTGKEIPTIQSIFLLHDYKGEPVFLANVVTDITDRKEAEEKIRRQNMELAATNEELEAMNDELISSHNDILESENKILELNEELEDRVKTRTVELQLTNESLQESLETLQKTKDQLVQSEKMASLGELVAGVAHEINTPIGVGVTAASFLEDKSQDLSKLYLSGRMKRPDLEKYLTIVTDASSSILINLERAVELIQSFKQVAVDQSSQKRRIFRLKEYIEEVLKSLSPRYKSTGHSISIQCPENLEIDSYPGIFFQVISNLVANSLIHGFENIEEGEMIFDIRKKKEEIIFQYHDNGVGIEASELSRIFDPFFTTKRGSGGTGLGLHIVYNLVVQTLEGGITCQSSPGKGTTFIMKIPVKPG
ncbi:MAG: PAS domain S-box protein [bacterium]|nr:PAS domain S-box protein [bacterium]